MTTKKTFKTELKPGESLTIGDTVVRVEKKSGQICRLVIEANENTRITIPHAARKSALQTE